MLVDLQVFGYGLLLDEDAPSHGESFHHLCRAGNSDDMESSHSASLAVGASSRGT
jgi:hypothetical protein